MAGRPPGAQNKDKPFRDALRVESKLAENGEETPSREGSLRWIARQLLIRAGKDNIAAGQVADRLDGKAPQAIIGDSDEDPINVLNKIERVIVGSK